MERIAFQATPQQKEWLTGQAKALGISPGEYLRRLIDQVRGGYSKALAEVERARRALEPDI
jgi:hypothetical protein